MDGVVYASFKDACIAKRLLEDDKEWIQCLEEAAAMQTGSQLRSALYLSLFSLMEIPHSLRISGIASMSMSVMICSTNSSTEGFLNLQTSRSMTMVST